MCLDSGTYMMNLKMCSQCSSNNLATTNKSASEERNIEAVTYNRKIVLKRSIKFT